MFHRYGFLLQQLLVATSVTRSLAQQVGFTIYPQQVLTGLTYQVAWLSNGQPATIQLVRNGRVEQPIYSAAGNINSFQWAVEDDLDGAVDYTLNLVTNGQTIAAPVMVIEDEDGLVVSGTTITAPSATAAITGVPTTLSFPPSISTTPTTSPSSTSTPNSNALPSNIPPGLSGGAIAGIVIGALAAVALIVAGIWLCRRRKHRSRLADSEGSIKNFLAPRGGGDHRVAHGTSPEIKEAPGDEKFNSAVGAGKSLSTSDIRDSTISNVSEVHGDSHIPWNELDGGPRASVINGSSEADGRTVYPVYHELPADSVKER